MPSPNAKILGSDTGNARRMTKSKMEEFNPSGVMMNNAYLNRRPEFYIYIFNVLDMQHRIERQWAHPAVLIPPCENGQPYSRPFVIPDIVSEILPRMGAGHLLGVNGVAGKFLAQDALFPDDSSMTGNWQTYQRITLGNAMNFGTDLYSLGCWWTLNEEPDPDSDEVTTARKRVEGTFNELIEKATELSLQGGDGIKNITPMMHRAANYFKLTTPWHQRFTAKIECPGCGELVPTSIFRHMPRERCGFVFNWPGAVRGGQATREEAREAGVELFAAKPEPEPEPEGAGNENEAQQDTFVPAAAKTPPKKAGRK